MATLNEPVADQIEQWIAWLDNQIGRLSDRRDALRNALATFTGTTVDHGAKITITTGHGGGGGPSETTPPKNVGGRPRAQVPPDEALEARRKADAERKKAERRHNKTKSPAARQAVKRPGGSKYDYAEVTRIAMAARRAGLPMAATVASKFGVSSAMGSFLIVEARKRGHDIPSRQSATTSATPLAAVPDIETVGHPASRAFTPADTLRIIEGGVADG